VQKEAKGDPDSGWFPLGGAAAVPKLPDLSKTTLVYKLGLTASRVVTDGQG